jgi:hypothetical protein
MSATETVSVGEPMPSIGTVAPIDSLRLLVTWSAGARANTTTEVDLAPLLFSLKIFAPLRHDDKLFQTAHVIEDGSAVAWGDDDRIDMAATSIERLADETMTASDFEAVLQRHQLSLDAASAQFGISRRLVAYYRTGRKIPRYIALACRYLDIRKQAAAAPAIIKKKYVEDNLRHPADIWIRSGVVSCLAKFNSNVDVSPNVTLSLIAQMSKASGSNVVNVLNIGNGPLGQQRHLSTGLQSKPDFPRLLTEEIARSTARPSQRAA